MWASGANNADAMWASEVEKTKQPEGQLEKPVAGGKLKPHQECSTRYSQGIKTNPR